jgi:transposase
MRGRAANIEAAAERAIYSDDPDAPERLRERIAGMEAERDRIKAYNADCRAMAKVGAMGDRSILDQRRRDDLASIERHCPYQLRPGHALPAYATSNLSGNIGRLRERLASFGPETAQSEHTTHAQTDAQPLEIEGLH